MDDVVRVVSLDQLAERLRLLGELYVRFSSGPEADAAATSTDRESGCALPGLSVNPLTPEPWWTRPTEHWLARQLCQYAHLSTGDRFGWVLTGRVVGRGPDSEPLISGFRLVALLDDSVLVEADEVYHSVFDAGRV